ncbi:hypothetical protein ACGFNP_25550 [Nonomuraea sp. NPDC049269]|uniref:hypothetical protein n=1 Tax=Nonomuraea sp. NPDC049269 TaxID=3364349 RepID=UPI00371B91B2
MKQKKPQEYSADEFDAVVALIEGDADVRTDIEAITGQSLKGKSPRELFDLFRALEGAAQAQAVVVRYGQAKRALRQTRSDLASPAELPKPIADYVADLQAKVDEEKRRRLQAEAALKQATRPGLAAVPSTTPRKAVG